MEVLVEGLHSFRARSSHVLGNFHISCRILDALLEHAGGWHDLNSGYPTTLLFVGEGTGGPGASPIFRAVDKETGEIVAEIDLPNNQSGLPFTYEHDGKQYVSMFVSGGGQPAELVAYALP